MCKFLAMFYYTTNTLLRTIIRENRKEFLFPWNNIETSVCFFPYIIYLRELICQRGVGARD